MFDMDAAYREYAVMVYKFLLSLCYEEELAEELVLCQDLVQVKMRFSSS